MWKQWRRGIGSSVRLERPSRSLLLIGSRGCESPPLDMKPKKPLSHQSNLRILAANNCSDPLQLVDPQLTHLKSASGLLLTISCRNSKDTTDSEFQWMTDLTEANMRDHYQKSEYGWNRKQKEKEFRHETARILFVTPAAAAGDEAPSPVAFVHFRFELDDEEKHPALYCYEIQVAKEQQSQGVGKHLMRVLREIGSRFKMYKVMLTCFKHNETTLSWYQSLGYTPDVCSPEKSGMNVSYFIMSSRIREAKGQK